MAQATDNEIYNEALRKCRCGCIYQEKVGEEGSYVINNVVWVKNMQKQRHSRKNHTSKEMDNLLRQSLYQELKNKKFDNEHAQVKLLFTVQFEIEDQSIQSFTLCENCFVLFNQHKSKNELILQFI
jgi:hypothetical protein